VAAGNGLDIRAKVKRLHVDDRGKAVLLAPVEEFLDRAAIGAARVRVADVGDEEFPKAATRTGVRPVIGTSWFMPADAWREPQAGLPFPSPNSR